MNDRLKKIVNTDARQRRTRSKTKGTNDRPRLCVKISATNVSAQIINDETHSTVASATTIGSKVSGTMTEKAEKIGEKIAKEASSKKINKVVLDRGSRQYHGRIKAFAEAARKNGLEF